MRKGRREVGKGRIVVRGREWMGKGGRPEIEREVCANDKERKYMTKACLGGLTTYRPSCLLLGF